MLKPYTKEYLEKLCKNSFSYAEVLRKSGRVPCGGNYNSLKHKIEEFNIDISHFTGKIWNKGKTKNNHSSIFQQSKNKEKYTEQEIFTKNSKVSQKVLRGYIQRHQIIKYQCANCGCDGNWQGGKISLELDHINGINNDNEISNLRYLCPNCHALTDTYRGKNKKNT